MTFLSLDSSLNLGVRAVLAAGKILLFTTAHIKELERLNEKMIAEITQGDFTSLFATKKFILLIKHGLYDFPPQNYLAEWELANGEKHRQSTDSLKEGKGPEAAAL